MKKKNLVLIVDDDADDREIIRDAFAANKGEVDYLFLENGDALIEYLLSSSENQAPSLILLDLNMPGKDGREALKEIKGNKLLQPIPIIVFTTSSLYRDKQMAYNLGANCFITKPDTFNKLVELASGISMLWLREE